MMRRGGEKTKRGGDGGGVAGYEESGLTRRAYGERRGIAPTTLDYYRRRIEVSGEFVAAELARLLRTVERA